LSTAPSKPTHPWSEIEPWLDQALEQPEGERLAWLQAQPLPATLQQELLALLRAEQASRDLLDSAPALLGLPKGGEEPPAAAALAEGERVGVWRVQWLIGRGGSGEVYRVQRDDGTFEQVAALKLLRTPGDAEELQRFSAERRLLARLNHPAIARLIDGGAHGGRLYAVLELVEGLPLDQHARSLGLQQRMALFEQVVAAVAYAHGQWVVHRDLKPANVLVDGNGQVRLLDFGIAKLVEGPAADGPKPNTTLALRLTPSHCAPEQLQSGAVSAAADVYALGVVLYELLADVPPWTLQGNGLQQAVQRLRQTEPPPPPSTRVPRLRAAALRGDLDAICSRCLQPQPQARYANAQALLEDLQRWRQGLPVLARGDAPGYVLGRLVRRHRMAFGAAAAVLLSLLLGLAGVAWQAREAAAERDAARAEARINKSVRDYLSVMFRVAGEQPGGSEGLSARELLSRTAQRLNADLQADPAQAAQTLLALAQLYFQMNDYVGAVPLFEQLLAHEAQLEPAMMAQVRLDLAQALLRSGQAERAAGLLEQAQTWWQQDPRRWRVQLLESRLVQAQVARARGDVKQSVALLQAALPERVAVSGEQHVETATLLNNLALARLHAGELDAAQQDFERAWALWQALGMPYSTDGLNTLSNWAALALRQGRAEEAERLFREALALRKAHLPPSAAQAALQNNLGKLLLRRGAAAEALPLLQGAVDMAQQFAGPASQHALAAMAGVAEAQIALGDLDAAAATLDTLEQRTRAQWGEQHLLTGVAHFSRARWHAARQDWPAAHAEADRAITLWQAAGAPAEPHLAQARATRAGWPPP
jgi:non-specific serine/threonine protein kinase/serine/threonine-protein kinase